jgi:hypothetical protein
MGMGWLVVRVESVRSTVVSWGRGRARCAWPWATQVVLASQALVGCGANEGPVAHAGADQVVALGTEVRLDGSASQDPDGDRLTFRWTAIQVPPFAEVHLDLAGTERPRFVAAANGTYRFQLVVADADSESAPVTVTVTCELDGNQRFGDPAAECGSCHERQYQEWRGSMMAYGAVSPVFHALEAAGNAITHGALASDGNGGGLFCQRCHTPVSVALEEFPAFAVMDGAPSSDFIGATGARGISCDVCHQMVHADLPGSLLGDGIANSAFVFGDDRTKYGPLRFPAASPAHESEGSPFVDSSALCGSCHDVRPGVPDVETGEPFQRLENLFTEWAQGPYASTANPFGRVVSCQDCHMSAYPYSPPGTYFQDTASNVEGSPVRIVSTHYFTGVDVALADFPFPGQSGSDLDSHGLPIAQQVRRADLLRAACTLEVEGPSELPERGPLPITVSVTNTGAGHNVPSGFSQERQVWIELTVVDGGGRLLYRSGHLQDSPHPETGEFSPDGSLHDEDLQNLVVELDPDTLEATRLEHGPDHDERKDSPPRNKGLVSFGNEFLRIDHETGEEEEVFVPFLANHMDNSHSIPPLETRRFVYDVPLPRTVQEPVVVRARLRFRAFPPRFLRLLARARPDLLDEALVDRNRIVEMAQAATVVPESSEDLAVALGSSGAVRRLADGTLAVLGGNGDGAREPEDRPSWTGAPQQGVAGVVAVVAGADHGLALLEEGEVLSWGSNGAGQLGDGTRLDRQRPVRVAGLTGVVALAAGTAHSLALHDDGTVWTWGANTVGQLGIGRSGDRERPVRVEGLPRVAALAAGAGHSLALTVDGQLFCWGSNARGQLGDGGVVDAWRPVALERRDPRRLVAVAGGGEHSLALRSDGVVLSWGANESGQLGIGTKVDSLLPIEVPGLLGVTRILAGPHTSLALQDGAVLWTWGRNDSGRIETTPVSVP